VASAEAKQSLERQGDYRSIQAQPRAPRRRTILYAFVGEVPTFIGSYGISRALRLDKTYNLGVCVSADVTPRSGAGISLSREFDICEGLELTLIDIVDRPTPRVGHTVVCEDVVEGRIAVLVRKYE
jgi:hypothetical protein